MLIDQDANPAQEPNDLGRTLLAFAIFNTYTMLWAPQVDRAVLSLFVALEATLITLFIGDFAISDIAVKVSGHLGVITALYAW